MAAGTLSAPGTKYGPCSEPCNHLDCELTRSMAESKCKYCKKTIGYDVRFYGSGQGYVHAACEERFINSKHKKETK